MSYLFREIRLHDIDDALAFAGEHGISVTPDQLHHHLSLVVKQDDVIIAAGLCLEPEPGHFVVRFALAVPDEQASAALNQDLANRVLRKMQAKGIGTARLTGAVAEQDATLWDQTNWLDRIQAVLPPGVTEDEPADAAVDKAQIAAEAEELVDQIVEAGEEQSCQDDCAESDIADSDLDEDHPAAAVATPQAA